MPVRRILLWTLLALAGLLIAVGVTTAATSLTSQRVGLQAEPLDAGVELAPSSRRENRATPTPTADPTPDASPSPEAGDDRGSDDSGHGRGRGRGRGRSGDDD
jgi:hypothetical protein